MLVSAGAKINFRPMPFATQISKGEKNAKPHKQTSKKKPPKTLKINTIKHLC